MDPLSITSAIINTITIANRAREIANRAIIALKTLEIFDTNASKFQTELESLSLILEEVSTHCQNCHDAPEVPIAPAIVTILRILEADQKILETIEVELISRRESRARDRNDWFMKRIQCISECTEELRCCLSRWANCLYCFECTTEPSYPNLQQNCDMLNSNPERRHDSTTSCCTVHCNTDNSDIVRNSALKTDSFEPHWAATDKDSYVLDPLEYRASAHLRSTGNQSWRLDSWLADGVEMACAAASAVALSHYDHQRSGQDDSLGCQSDSQYSSPASRCSMLSSIPPAAGIFGAIGIYGIAAGSHYYRHMDEQHKDRLLLGGGTMGVIWGFAMGLEPQSIIFRILPGVVILALFISTFISNASERKRKGYYSSLKDGGICTDCSLV